MFLFLFVTCGNLLLGDREWLHQFYSQSLLTFPAMQTFFIFQAIFFSSLLFVWIFSDLLHVAILLCIYNKISELCLLTSTDVSPWCVWMLIALFTSCTAFLWLISYIWLSQDTWITEKVTQTGKGWFMSYFLYHDHYHYDSLKLTLMEKELLWDAVNAKRWLPEWCKVLCLHQFYRAPAGRCFPISGTPLPSIPYMEGRREIL